MELLQRMQVDKTGTGRIIELVLLDLSLLFQVVVYDKGLVYLINIIYSEYLFFLLSI